MAKALVRVLDDPNLRQRLSGGALARAREMSLDAHVDALERVLTTAARRSRTADEVGAHP
jgi:glycosyltransferase involved in cell wall biosynthesis